LGEEPGDDALAGEDDVQPEPVQPPEVYNVRLHSVEVAMLLSMLPHERWSYKYIRDEDTGKGDSECRVCLSEYEPDEDLVRLPCMHYAHLQCMEEWLIRSPKCPVCRTNVREALFIEDHLGGQ